MNIGQVEKAERIAQNEFDKWNDVTGVISDGSSYYYEILEVIKDAVHIGIQMSIEGKVDRDSNGQVKRQPK